MHVVIFEGIATSGKSTLIGLLQASHQAQVFSEEQTHEPIMEQVSDAHLDFYRTLIAKIDDRNEFVIFDRLYLTQAFRAKLDLDAYTEIEQALSMYPTITVFLTVDETAIAQRVSKAMEHRPSSWGDYVKTKGKDSDQIADYYIQQQRSQLALLKQSTLPYKVFDTTHHEYQKIAAKITKLL